MKNKIKVLLLILGLSLSFCLISFAGFKGQTETKSNRFSIVQVEPDKEEIDWAEIITIQWCEYPFEVDVVQEVGN